MLYEKVIKKARFILITENLLALSFFYQKSTVTKQLRNASFFKHLKKYTLTHFPLNIYTFLKYEHCCGIAYNSLSDVVLLKMQNRFLKARWLPVFVLSDLQFWLLSYRLVFLFF